MDDTPLDKHGIPIQGKPKMVSETFDRMEILMKNTPTQMINTIHDQAKEIKSLKAQIERVLALVSKNEKRRSSGLVGCDEIRKTIKGGQ